MMPRVFSSAMIDAAFIAPFGDNPAESRAWASSRAAGSNSLKATPRRPRGVKCQSNRSFDSKGITAMARWAGVIADSRRSAAVRISTVVDIV